MVCSLRDFQLATELLWPPSGTEPWDAPGLLSGSPAAEISRVLVAVDAVADTADEAIETGADVLFVHHPLLLRGVTSVAEDRYKGALLGRLIRGGCALLAAHTNADVVETGTSAVMADALGLTGTEAIVPGTLPGTGLGRVGRLPQRTTLGRLAAQLAAIVPATASGIRVAGDYDAEVNVVALCAGAGDSLLNEPAVLAADVYITSDLRHHPASEAREQSRIGAAPALIDVSHWASEWLWLEQAARQLRDALPGLDVTVSDIRTDPWDFAIAQ